MIKKAIMLCMIISAVTACSKTKDYENFQEYKSLNQTQLSYIGESPQGWDTEALPEFVTEVLYESDGLHLKAWYAQPQSGDDNMLMPAVVYIHGGFALGISDLYDALPFLENGFSLLIPTFRSENGNPGNFELMFGEVDDAIAAVQWLGELPGIDKNRIFVFGHSSGGGMAALTSLYDEPLINLTGSSGGLYTDGIFYSWKDFCPFDYKDKTERNLRVLLGNTEYMKKPHISYIGKEDILAGNIGTAEKEIKKTKAPLKIQVIEGDHFSSLNTAVLNFIEEIKNE